VPAAVFILTEIAALNHTFEEVVMLEKEPLSFPARRYYPLNVGIADRQLWAIGMVVTQWGMTEYIREQEIYTLIGDDASLAEEYKRIRHSQLKTKF